MPMLSGVPVLLCPVAGRSPSCRIWHILAPMPSIETEIKFRVPDEDALEAKLLSAGFRKQTEKTFERNVLYDYPDRKLRSNGEILQDQGIRAKVGDHAQSLSARQFARGAPQAAD